MTTEAEIDGAAKEFLAGAEIERVKAMNVAAVLFGHREEINGISGGIDDGRSLDAELGVAGDAAFFVDQRNGGDATCFIEKIDIPERLRIRCPDYCRHRRHKCCRAW